MNSQDKKTRPLALLALAASIITSGALLGATTNAINGKISPQYFQSIMGWRHIKHLWSTIIAQGIFEGLIYGLIFSVVFSLVVGIVSKAQCTYSYAMRHMLAIIAGVLGCWILGGLIGMGLAFLSPDFYRQTFYEVPEQLGPMMRFAWVGGSIWGMLLGSILAGAIGSVLFAVHWRQDFQLLTCTESH